MIPGQREQGHPSPPIKLLDSVRQARIVRLGPFTVGGLELPGTREARARGRAGDQLTQVANVYAARGANDPIIKIEFTVVNAEAEFEFPGADMRGLYPIELIINRGADDPTIVQEQGLVKLVLTHLGTRLVCARKQGGTKKTVSGHARHVILRADGEIMVMV